MEALVFPNEEALQVALRSGLVPPEIQREPAHVGVTPEGAVEIAPVEAVAPKVRKALEAAGVTARVATAPLAAISCWAEAVTPRRVGEPDGALPHVLFAVAGRASLLELCGELLRLGCDRQELSLAGPPHAHALLRVVDPPWFVLSRALDRLDGLRAFVPAPAGQERIWSEIGYEHPLAATLEAPDSGLVLVTGEGAWWRLADTAWTDVDTLLVPVGLQATLHEEASLDVPRVQVRLMLARAARPETPTLFLVPNGRAQVEALVRSTPETQLENVLFAVAGELVLLRARPGREAAAAALPGEPYARVQELPNLFAPAGLTLEPPLRRDRLRAWLAADADLVTWLEPTEHGFRSRAVLEAAFRPLSEWVDYIIDGAAETLTAWARSATFDFAPFIALEDARPSASDAAPGRPEAAPASPRPRRPEASKATRDVARQESGTPPVAVTVEVPASLSEAEALVAREEAAFLELDVPADSPGRREAWGRLAELYARVQRPRDAGMAWAHALWEASATEALPLARRWVTTSGVRLEAVATLAAPNPEQTRGVVAHLLAAALEGNSPIAARAAEWAAFLDRFADELDVRSYWLGRVAVSRLAGGDALGLARGRDRVLARLQAGLSLDRDVPRLLRVMGQANAAGAGTGRALRVTAQLEAVLKAIDETPRKRSAVEAPPHLTRAYVALEFAWGFARLANADRARQLRDAALAALDQRDPVHHYLARAYQARVEQALEGAAPDTPLPPDVNALLNGLESFVRYKVDRLRQFSQVLEPQERLEAISAFWRNTRDTRGEELAALRGLREPGELLKAIQSRMSVASDGHLPEDERARLIDGLLDYLPRLPEAHALPLLARFVTMGEGLGARQRALVLEDALKVAGHFGRTALVKQYVLQLGNVIKELGSAGVSEVGGVLVAGVRSLRRVGLRDEAAELLSRASTVLKGEDVATLQARLGLASGFMYLGAFAQGQPIIEEALMRLGRESGLNPGERQRLTRATTQALSHASTELALPGLLRVAQQLPWITDSYNTNTHYCLALVDFADALVLGHVGDDLTLNETTRRFLDEDEYLVRRRVHRDVGGAA